MDELIIVPTTKSVPEELSLETKAVKRQRNFKAPKTELSENIQKFDQRPRVYTENPFSFGEVVKRQAEITTPSPTATQMITNPLYNEVGKILGVDTIHEWGLNYDKVFEIVELAKKKSGLEKPEELSSWIYQLLSQAPSIGSKKINDVHIYLKMGSREVIDGN